MSLTDWAFAELGLGRVQVFVAPENIAALGSPSVQDSGARACFARTGSTATRASTPSSSRGSAAAG